MDARLGSAWSAAITFVRKGNEITAAGSSITLTLSVASTAGDLLVATISDVNGNCTTDSITGPSGWVRAAHSCRGSAGPVEIWYRANAPSTSSAVFSTASTGSNTRGQLSEFSGVATSSPLDQTGIANTTSASTSLAVTTSGSLAASGEVAVTAYNTTSGLSSFTAPSGWNSLTSDTSAGFDSDYRLSPASGSTLTETVTSSPSSSWGAVIATFKPPCSGGTLSMTAPSSTAFTGVTLDGTNKTTTASVVLAPDDERGSGAGWNITGTSTTFTHRHPQSVDDRDDSDGRVVVGRLRELLAAHELGRLSGHSARRIDTAHCGQALQRGGQRRGRGLRT